MSGVPLLPVAHMRRVDDRRVINGIVHVIRRGLRWRDAPRGYGPHKTLHDRFVRSGAGIGNELHIGVGAWRPPSDGRLRPSLIKPRASRRPRGAPVRIGR